MKGITVPSASLGISIGSIGISSHFGGVKTTAYFHNAYQFGLYYMFPESEFGWGTVRVGLGLGVLLTAKGYKSTDQEIQNRNETAVGPATWIAWNFLGPLYLSVESLFGIGNAIDDLTFRDSTWLGLGVTF